MTRTKQGQGRQERESYKAETADLFLLICEVQHVRREEAHVAETIDSFSFPLFGHYSGCLAGSFVTFRDGVSMDVSTRRLVEEDEGMDRWTGATEMVIPGAAFG
jgi:hypothetical protein